VDQHSWPLGIRPADLVTVAVVIAVIELNVAVVGGGPSAGPLNAWTYVIGAVIALPLLLRRRWPLQVLWASFLLMDLYYVIDRRNISPAPLLAVPVYDAALAGYLAWAIAVPAVIMTVGLIIVGVFGHGSQLAVLADFLPSFAIFILAVALGEVVRGRRALAAETARRLRLAADELRSDAARLLAEERLRIARELHDTVAHSMATITVQAGSALHILSNPRSPNGPPDSPPFPQSADDTRLHDALLAIRETSKSALGEMRAVLGQLRGETGAPLGAEANAQGLSRLAQLRAAVTAAGSPVTVTVEGEQVPLPAPVDHAAYRILQESLTNVLRHTAPGTPAEVRLRYAPDAVTITVADNGQGDVPGDPVTSADTGSADAGNGIRGMRERAASVGGSLTAAPCPGGGFVVTAALPAAPSIGPAATGIAP
jgi:signal transduction histidine kinase